MYVCHTPGKRCNPLLLFCVRMLSGLVTVGRGSQQQFAFVGSSSAQHISPHLPSEQLARGVGLRRQQPHLDDLVVGA